MNKAIETLKAARAEAVREYDEAIAKLVPSTPVAKAKASAVVAAGKRVRSPEAKAKHLATLARKRAEKVAATLPAPALDAE